VIAASAVRRAREREIIDSYTQSVAEAIADRPESRPTTAKPGSPPDLFQLAAGLAAAQGDDGAADLTARALLGAAVGQDGPGRGGFRGTDVGG
jgi:hypothetical protein